MKEIINDLTTSPFYVLMALALRAVYDWEKTSIGQKVRQFAIGLILAFLVNKVYLDVYGDNIQMMKYIGAVVFSCAFGGEIALDFIIKKISIRAKNKKPTQ